MYLVYALLFLTPLVLIPWIPLGFEFPKVIFTEIVISLLTLITILKGKFDWKAYYKPVGAALIGITILSIYTFLRDLDTLSFVGNKFRLQGIVILWQLMLFSFISSGIKLKNISSYLLFIPFIILLALTLFIGPNLSDRWVSSLGDPNAFAATMVFWFPFLLYSLESRWSKLLLGVPIIVVLFITQSHSAVVAIFIQLICYLLFASKMISLSKSVIIGLLFILLSYSLPFFESKNIYENRVEIWQTSINAGLKNPLIGYGFGKAETGIKESAGTLNNSIQYQYVDSSHNIFLDWWIQGGTAGILLFIGLLYFVFRRLIQANQHMLLLSFLGIITVASFNPVSVVTLVALWWIVGQSLTEV